MKFCYKLINPLGFPWTLLFCYYTIHIHSNVKAGHAPMFNWSVKLHTYLCIECKYIQSCWTWGDRVNLACMRTSGLKAIANIWIQVNSIKAFHSIRYAVNATSIDILHDLTVWMEGGKFRKIETFSISTCSFLYVAFMRKLKFDGTKCIRIINRKTNFLVYKHRDWIGTIFRFP